MKTRWPSILLAALALASVAGNLYFAARLKRGFAEVHLARIFPTGVPSPARSPAARDTRPLLAIYGDSRALHWETKDLETRYAVANFAQGRQTSAQLLLQLTTQPAVASDWALVEIGINDLHPLGVLEDYRPAITRQLDANLQKIAQELSARAGCVLFIAILPPGRVPLLRRPLWSSATIDDVRRANARLRELSRGPSTMILDADRLLGGSDGYLDPRFVSAEFFLHLNSAAYAALNEQVLQLMPNAEAGVHCRRPEPDSRPDGVEQRS